MRPARKAMEIFHNRSIANVFDRGLDFLNAKMSKWGYAVSGIFWRLKGGQQEFTIGGVSATFDAEPARGGNTIRWRVNEEHKMISDLLKELEPDDNFYDIGASLGLHSVFAAQKLSDGAVFAFEPQGWNLTQLESNVSNNPVSVETFNVALSDSTDRVQFDTEQESIVADSHDTVESTEVIDAVEGDQFVTDEHIPQPNIVKIDVEGAEMLVIKGLRKTLSNEMCRRVYCEIHLPAEHRESVRSYGTDGAELMKYLSELGFDIEIIDTRGREIQIVGSK